MKSIAVLTVLSAASLLHASPLPADYAIKTSCQTQAQLTVCRSLQAFPKLAVLDVTYKGKLSASGNQQMWIKVNYRHGSSELNVVPLTLRVDTATGQAEAHYRVTGGCLRGSENRTCGMPGTSEMRQLLQWAQTASGTLNALDLNIAFFDGSGWDNNDQPLGNYHFVFAQD